MKVREVSELEYAGLLNLEQVIRVALVNPGCGEFIAVAIQALDTVRREEGIQMSALELPAPGQKQFSAASELVTSLIKRASRP
jgi:hypothetical protein